MLNEDDKLIADYLKTHKVNTIDQGHTRYNGKIPTSKKSRLLMERHERRQQVYRDLIKRGVKKNEIARILHVSEAQVRKMANMIGLINELRR